MKPKPLFTLLLLITAIQVDVIAQQPTTKSRKRPLNHLSIAFSNAHTAMPFGKFSKLFTSDFHPGFQLSTGFNWKVKPKHDLFQTINAGYSYHRWVQHSIVLYTEWGYRYKLPAGFSTEAKIGGGYMRAIVATEVFSDGVQDGHQYGKISSGRSQGMATVGLALHKRIKVPCEFNVFLEYQQRFQTPFIQSYVPLLPYNIMMAGVKIPFK